MGIRHQLEQFDTYLKNNLGSLIIMIIVSVVPVMMYGVHMVLPLDQAVLIGKQDSYDIYNISKVLTLFSLIAFLVVVFINDILRYRKRFKLGRMQLLAFVFLIIAGVSAMQSKYQFQAIFGQYDRYEGFITQVLYIALFCFSSFYVRSREELSQVMYGVLISAFVLSVVGILQSMGHNFFESSFFQTYFLRVPLAEGVKFGFPESRAAYAMLGNPNHVGTYASLVLPMQLGFSIWVQNRTVKAGAIVSMILTWTFFLMSRSTGGYIGILLGCITVLMGAFIYSRDQFKPMAGVLALVVSMGVLITVILDPTAIAPSTHNVLQSNPNGLYINEIILENNNVQIRFNDSQRLNITYDGNALHYTNHQFDDIIAVNDQGKIAFSDSSYARFDHQIYQVQNAIELVFTELGFSLQANEKQFWYTFGFDSYTELQSTPHVDVSHHEKWGSGRLYIWSRTLPILKETFWIGKGVDTFMHLFPQHDVAGKFNMGQPRIIVDKPHNLYLLIGTTIGIIGLGVFIILVWLNIVRIKELIRMDTETIPAASLMGALVGFSGVVMVNDSTVPVMTMFWALMGIAVGITQNTKSTEVDYERLRCSTSIGESD